MTQRERSDIFTTLLSALLFRPFAGVEGGLDRLWRNWDGAADPDDLQAAVGYPPESRERHLLGTAVVTSATALLMHAQQRYAAILMGVACSWLGYALCYGNGTSTWCPRQIWGDGAIDNNVPASSGGWLRPVSSGFSQS